MTLEERIKGLNEEEFKVFNFIGSVSTGIIGDYVETNPMTLNLVSSIIAAFVCDILFSKVKDMEQEQVEEQLEEQENEQEEDFVKTVSEIKTLIINNFSKE